ncbi:ribosome production factor 2 homolog [Daphnia magna]|uniref:Ribosome production factor 2 homolog n=1 Tax=Daphnia magna TaxID=35525 RepID=A0A0P5BAM3_9CRUS|nr:ribosome production factor 2 homolog [Daphnia magna]KZS14861.1 Ribosome production factor 2 [Daphnia magna]
MSVRITKPKTHRGKRMLAKREPKIIELSKKALMLRGATASATSLQFVKDLHAIKRTQSTYFGQKHPFNPFEDVKPIEELTQKYDLSLFAFCSHNKKRANNVILGRIFDHQLLDMIEFGVEQFKSLTEIKNSKVMEGTKPCLIFSGDVWHQNEEYSKCKSLLIDFFRGESVEQVRLAGFEHALSFTAADGKIFLRSYKILMTKSGTKTPHIELEEIGPSADLVIRRTKLASADLFKRACRTPSAAKPKKVKNMSKDVFGSKLGRIHMPRQDYRKLQVKRGRALRTEKTPKKSKISK